MFDRLKDHFLKFDWIIFSAVFLLSLFGLIEIYSIALGQETISLINFKKQIFYVVFGVILLFVSSFVDYNLIKSLNKYIYIFGVILLIAVLFLGKTIRGTTGWFDVFGLSLQPVEFIKIILIVFLANFFSNSTFKNRPFKNLILSFLGMFVLVFLVLLQPDFGPAMIMVALWFLILILAGLDKKYLLLIIIPSFLLAFLSWNFYLKDYQKNRILTFLNPASDSLGEGYNVSQALIAVGSGSLTGRGVGFGSQSQLKFLPEAQNDFIFSVISEELGFLGSFLVLFIYFVLFARFLFLLRKTKDDFAIFFILGSMVLIFIEMFINIGMNIGIMPVVGISLPFVSYGGSATLANFVLIGIIQNIIIRSKS
ncbi:rod shape-determining protein RodA [Candidatus Falkowbacteria bacterium HGW-Falkowbacteria-1]|uniref:Rod shape-determining protein RodA n=1 Tax=Candidatus Falkowbacteria bacterium HGW-Falkowbacteria-1 TaxID=2013768 RepID=A0A2N2E9J3_9BACT|nr:MAG: rod shape-determining protein RodA [Candidatus Falkowbacteria bacterium HGW-Falkowbacteria-1]